MSSGFGAWFRELRPDVAELKDIPVLFREDMEDRFTKGPISIRQSVTARRERDLEQMHVTAAKQRQSSPNLTFELRKTRLPSNFVIGADCRIAKGFDCWTCGVNALRSEHKAKRWKRISQGRNRIATAHLLMHDKLNDGIGLVVKFIGCTKEVERILQRRVIKRGKERDVDTVFKAKRSKIASRRFDPTGHYPSRRITPQRAARIWRGLLFEPERNERSAVVGIEIHQGQGSEFANALAFHA